jgi:hypothetical protein
MSGATTLSIVTLNITTFSIMTLCKMAFFINDIKHSNNAIDYCYADRLYAESTNIYYNFGLQL